MKEYQIIKGNKFYAIANKKDIEDYSKKHFLPYISRMKFKKYLIESINKNINLKNNVDFKTYYIY